MRYTVTHRTTYDYPSTVSVSHHLARLAPRQTGSQNAAEHELRVEPTPVLVEKRLDYYGNSTTFMTVEGAHRQLTFLARSVVEVTAARYPAPAKTPPWEAVRDDCLGGALTHALEAGEFAFASQLVPRRPALADYAAKSFETGRPIIEAVLDLTRRVYSEFEFDPTATTVSTPVEQVFKRRRGVCQDFAQLEIACLRSIGLPARYVSGYLETAPPPGRPRLVGADASHAWLAFYCPDFGWIDVDPTNNVLPSGRHVTLAWGRDYSDVSPLRGVVVGGGKHRMKVAVDVVPTKDEGG
jgi:transglutaminase-like putative cysteine protease